MALACAARPWPSLDRSYMGTKTGAVFPVPRAARCEDETAQIGSAIQELCDLSLVSSQDLAFLLVTGGESSGPLPQAGRKK